MNPTKEGEKRRGAGDNTRSQAGEEKKRRSVNPIEGAQTGSEGLGYLGKPDKAGTKGERNKDK